jgi:hypothetical protein
MTITLSQMDQQTRAAALRTVYDPQVHNPRATELRAEAIAVLGESVAGLRPDELAHRVAAIRAIQEAARAGDSTPAPRSVAEDASPGGATATSPSSPFFAAPVLVRPVPVDHEADPGRRSIQQLRQEVAAAISLEDGRSPFWARPTK